MSRGVYLAFYACAFRSQGFRGPADPRTQVLQARRAYAGHVSGCQLAQTIFTNILPERQSMLSVGKYITYSNVKTQFRLIVDQIVVWPPSPCVKQDMHSLPPDIRRELYRTLPFRKAYMAIWKILQPGNPMLFMSIAAAHFASDCNLGKDIGFSQTSKI